MGNNLQGEGVNQVGMEGEILPKGQGRVDGGVVGVGREASAPPSP